jgi:uncharacterized membrane protein YhaH (DUF805 family)
MKKLLRICVRPWHQRGQDASWCLKVLFPLIGLAAFVWFLIRVLPKPSRAAYPCQRLAFPLASSFVLWLMGLVGSWHFMRRAARAFSKHKRLVGIGSVLGAVLLAWAMLSLSSNRSARAGDPRPL